MTVTRHQDETLVRIPAGVAAQLADWTPCTHVRLVGNEDGSVTLQLRADPPEGDPDA